MHRVRWLTDIASFSILLIIPLTLYPVSALPQTVDNRGALVGRITVIDSGQLLRYVPMKKDWVVTLKDTPFAPTDALYSGNETRAEFTIPESSLIRVGGDTQLELMKLSQGLTQADVASGKARFRNKTAKGVIEVTTPYGYVVGPPGTSFDLYVGDDTLEVVSLEGKVDFIHDADQAKYPVTAGSSSIIANGKIVTSGPGRTAEDWEQWNESRDSTLAKENQAGSESAQHLPQELRDYRSDLDRNGKWQSVTYKGKPHKLWRPANVQQDWAPFTQGAWMDYDGDNDWVPDEPFGYVTMHYGNWIWVDNGWFWAPPGAIMGISSECDSCWFPGRVGWIYTDEDVGWFPLAPSETFYAANQWGPGIVVIDAANINNIHVDFKNFEFAKHAVVVNQNVLFGHINYAPLRIKGVNVGSIASTFHITPVLRSAVVKNYALNSQRFAVGKEKPTFKPGHAALDRIAYNARTVKLASTQGLKNIQRTLATAKPGQLSRNSLNSPSMGGKLLNPNGAKVSTGQGGKGQAPTTEVQPGQQQTVNGNGAHSAEQGGRKGLPSGISKTGAGLHKPVRVTRPITPPAPTVAEKALGRKSAHPVKQARRPGQKGRTSREFRARSRYRTRREVSRRHMVAPSAEQRAARERGAHSGFEAGRTTGPRSGDTHFRSRSSGYPSVSGSAVSKQWPRSSTGLGPHAQTPSGVTPRPRGATPTPGVFRGQTAEPKPWGAPQRTNTPRFRPGPFPYYRSTPERYRMAPSYSSPHHR
ncbi:MAG: FecR family protein [Syntrophobacteraceae bacterium]|nr:FecR family protein [Syntrophobacteraceae bacterium]